MTNSFETELNKHKNLRNGHAMTDTDLACLCMAAKDEGRDAHPAAWAAFRFLLENNTNLDAKGVKATYRECKLIAEIGVNPFSVHELPGPWLKAKGYRMNFSGEFGNAHDADYILNEMAIWNTEVLGQGTTVFPKDNIRPAFNNWMSREQERMIRSAYASVRFDPNASKEELTKFAMLIVEPCEDEEQWARNIRAAEIAFENFIYRVKNHMRGRWYHGIHMMPILYGPQGSGKTTAVRHLLSPLEEFASAVGFDIFDHDGKMYKLSQTPIMFFDEMAGISKAENERLKDIMHTRSRELRKLYGNPSTRTIISTFIGCTNKDISTLIKDETGNRRYLQIDTPRLRREDILAIDAMTIWRSVDEDGEPPLYARAEDLKIVQDVQREQRHMGRVEHWLEVAIDTKDWLKASELFERSYTHFLMDAYPGQDRFENLQSFGRELNRLLREGHPRLRMKNGPSTKLWQIIEPTTNVVPLTPPTAKVATPVAPAIPAPAPKREPDAVERLIAKARARTDLC